MKNSRMKLASLAALLALTIPAVVLAEAPKPETPTTPSQPQMQTQGSGAVNGQGQIQTSAPADQASAEAAAAARAEERAKISAVLERGAKQSAKSRADAEAKIQMHLEKVDETATQEGDRKVAERLAGEFGTSAEALVAEKQTLGASWGELMIAHTLKANTSSDLTIEQIYQMKKDGNGWGQIAAGLGFKLGDVVSAAQAETKVATGAVKADGKVQAMHGVGAGVKGASGVGVKAGGAGAGVKAGVDAGVKVKPGHL